MQEGVEAAFLAEDFFDADGPDERRQDHRREQQRGERLLAGKLVVVAQPGERHRQREGRQRAGDGQQEGVAQPLDVHRIAKDFRDVVQREVLPGEERHAQGLRDGIEEEHREERGRQRINESGKGAGHDGGIITEETRPRQAAIRADPRSEKASTKAPGAWGRPAGRGGAEKSSPTARGAGRTGPAAPVPCAGAASDRS